MYETQAEIDEFFKCLFQFRPIRKLGEGAFGISILVFDEVEQIQKVFKLPKDTNTTNALCKEGNNLVRFSQLLHPNILRLRQFGKVRMTWEDTESDRYYLNMAYGGISLRSKLGAIRVDLDENGNPRYDGSGVRLLPEDALEIAVDVCQGLVAAHNFEQVPTCMVHRDIRPGNILIDEKTGIARLIDFGMARVIERSSLSATLAGNSLYMAPDCLHGKGSIQSDIYSLGIVIYEMVTGKLPFADFPQRLEMSPLRPTQLDPELPATFDDIVFRALDNNVESRYATAADLLADLNCLRTRLNPLPARLTRLAELNDGRHLCEDSETGQRVAVRLVNATASLTELAGQHSQLESLQLPNVEIPLRHFTNELFTGVVSREPQGSDLQELFSEPICRTLNKIEELCEVMASIADLLSVMHRNGLRHGLLSPMAFTFRDHDDKYRLHEMGSSPILCARRGAGGKADWREGLEPVLRYMSPQLLATISGPTPADDIFSFGAIFFELLTGQSPLCDSDREQIIHGNVVAEPSWNPRAGHRLIPKRLAGVVIKALHFNPHDRYDSASHVAEQIRACRWPQDSVDALVDDALEVFPKGAGPADLVEACGLIDQALHVDPGNPKAHFARAVLYFRDESYRFAVDELTKVISVLPSAEACDLLGQSYDRWGDHCQSAIDAYQKALECEEAAPVLERLARVLWKIENQTEAIQTMKRSIEIETDESIRQRRQRAVDQWLRESNTPADPTRFRDASDGE